MTAITYLAGRIGALPISLTLPSGGYVTNAYDALARLTRTELRTSAGALLNAHGYQYNLAHQRTLPGRTNSAYPTWNGYWLAGYDPAGQLTNAWAYQPDGTPNTSRRWEFRLEYRQPPGQGYVPPQSPDGRISPATASGTVAAAL